MIKIENPNPHLPINLEIVYEENWNPLYALLKELFYDKWEEAANGFMFMGKVKFWDGCELYDYKHGITRKAICLLPTGTPMKINSEVKWEMVEGRKMPVDYIHSLEEMSLGDTYKKVYEHIHKSFGVNEEMPEFTSYSKDYIEKRTQMLKDAGYNVVEISIHDSPEELKKKLNI